MSREDIQKLLGGYATGTLTSEEQQALFEAALDDQELFDALAREQSLRDLLQDPGARAHLLAALDDRPEPWYRKRWLMSVTYVTPLLAGIIGVSVVTLWMRTGRHPAPPPLVAVLKQAASPAAVEPAAPELRKQAPARAVSRRPQPPASQAEEKEQATEIAAARVPPQAAAAPPAPAPVEKAAAAEKSEEPAVATDAKKLADARPADRVTVRAEVAPAAGGGGVIGGIVGGGPGGTQDLAKGGDSSQSARSLFYGAPQAQQALLAENKLSGPAQNAQQNARQAQNAPGVFAVATGAAGAVSNLGVRYSILRKEPSGLFEQVDASALKTGDVVALRFVTNGAGYLSVGMPQPGGQLRVVFSTATVPLETYTTPALDAGVTRLQVGFAPRPQTVTRVNTANFVETANDASTYVVAPRGDVRFTIELTYR
jgi:hypothetical protein